MDRNDILEKSRKENRNMDERKKMHLQRQDKKQLQSVVLYVLSSYFLKPLFLIL
jgi:hypothetical protein